MRLKLLENVTLYIEAESRVDQEQAKTEHSPHLRSISPSKGRHFYPILQFCTFALFYFCAFLAISLYSPHTPATAINYPSTPHSSPDMPFVLLYLCTPAFTCYPLAPLYLCTYLLYSPHTPATAINYLSTTRIARLTCSPLNKLLLWIVP